MKRYYAYSFILVIGLILGACGTSESQDNTDSSEQTNEEESESQNSNGQNSEKSSVEVGASVEGEDIDLASGVDTVISSVKQLDSSLKDSADVSTINEYGKALEEDWDRIEKKVEEQFPDQYKKVEESLYPLIDTAQKDEPEVEKMKEWAQSTLDSLNELKQKIETQ